jgi:putative addiction module component (TIGR02574 family)
MKDPVSELARRGRELAPDDRERLVDQLLESLNESSVAEIDASWEAEIERRLAEVDGGRVQPIAAHDVFAKARRLAG